MMVEVANPVRTKEAPMTEEQKRALLLELAKGVDLNDDQLRAIGSRRKTPEFASSFGSFLWKVITFGKRG
jgi:hypothetical protein